MNAKAASSISKRIKCMNELSKQQASLIKESEALTQRKKEIQKETATISSQFITEQYMFIGEMLQEAGFPLNKKDLLIGMALELTDMFKDRPSEEYNLILDRYSKRFQSFLLAEKLPALTCDSNGSATTIAAHSSAT